MSTRSLNSSRQLPHIRMSGLPAKKLGFNIWQWYRDEIGGVGGVATYQDVGIGCKKSNVGISKHFNRVWTRNIWLKCIWASICLPLSSGVNVAMVCIGLVCSCLEGNAMEMHSGGDLRGFRGFMHWLHEILFATYAVGNQDLLWSWNWNFYAIGNHKSLSLRFEIKIQRNAHCMSWGCQAPGEWVLGCSAATSGADGTSCSEGQPVK